MVAKSGSVRGVASLSFLLLGVLVLSGCSSPAASSPTPGAPGGGTGSFVGVTSGSLTSSGALTTSQNGPSPTSVCCPPTSTGPIDHAPVITAFSANRTEGTFPMTVQVKLVAADQDKDPLSYKLGFGDGAGNATGTLPTGNLTHSYMAAGNFTVKLVVSDGKLNVSATLIVKVNAPPAPAAPIVKEQWYFSQNPTIGAPCNEDPLILVLADAQPDAKTCAQQILNFVTDDQAETATAASVSHAFPPGVAIHGRVYIASVDPVLATAPQPTTGTLSISVGIVGGAVLGSTSGTQTLTTGAKEVVFAFPSTAAGVPAGVTLYLGLDFDGPSGGITWGGGSDAPTGFAIGGDYTPGTPV